MPGLPFISMPDDARVWVFGTSQPVHGTSTDRLLDVVDGFIRSWVAHGAPVVGASDWRYDHFLIIAADERATGVSGCSIDSLYRTLRTAEHELGVTLLDSSPVWFRDAGGVIRCAGRPHFRELVAREEVGDATIVFDNTVGTVGGLRAGEWERPFAESWHARAFGPPRGRP
jgi:hypothetical protein